MVEYCEIIGKRGGSDVMRVLLGGRVVGTIRLVTGGFTYIPKGRKKGGEIFRTVREVQRSLDDEEEDGTLADS